MRAAILILSALVAVASAGEIGVVVSHTQSADLQAQIKKSVEAALALGTNGYSVDMYTILSTDDVSDQAKATAWLTGKGGNSKKAVINTVEGAHLRKGFAAASDLLIQAARSESGDCSSPCTSAPVACARGEHVTSLTAGSLCVCGAGREPLPSNQARVCRLLVQAAPELLPRFSLSGRDAKGKPRVMVASDPRSLDSSEPIDLDRWLQAASAETFAYLASSVSLPRPSRAATQTKSA